jgi:hypothetical protein
MLTRTNIVRVIVSIAVLTTAAILGSAVAQKPAVPKPQDKLALGEYDVKQLLLMDTDEERQNLQARMGEIYGSGVRPTG